MQMVLYDHESNFGSLVLKTKMSVKNMFFYVINPFY